MNARPDDPADRPSPRRLALWLPTLVPPLWWVWEPIEARGRAGIIAILAALLALVCLPIAILLGIAPAVLRIGTESFPLLANTYTLTILGQFALIALALAAAVWLIPPRLRCERVCRACLYPRPTESDERTQRCPECGNAWRAKARPPWRRRFNRNCGTAWSYEHPRGPATLAVALARVAVSLVLIIASINTGRALVQPLDGHVMSMPTPTLRSIATGRVPPLFSEGDAIGFFRQAAFGALATRPDLSVGERLEVAMDLDPDLLGHNWSGHAIPITAPSEAIIDLLVLALAQDELSQEAETRFLGPFTQNLVIDPPVLDPTATPTAARLVLRRDPGPSVPFGGSLELFFFLEPNSIVVTTKHGERELPPVTPTAIGTRRLQDGTSPPSVNVNALFPNAAPLAEHNAFVNGQREWLVNEIDPAVFTPGEHTTVVIRGTVFAEWQPGRTRNTALVRGTHSIDTSRIPPERLWERNVQIERSFVVPGG